MKAKKCSVCKKEKPISEFHRNSSSKDGIRSNCKDCYKEWRIKNISNERERNRVYYQSEKGKKRLSKYKSENCHKLRAKYIIKNDIKKGKIKRASSLKCYHCGKQAEDYHHPNYDFPRLVIPLCSRCHMEVHYQPPTPPLNSPTDQNAATQA